MAAAAGSDGCWDGPRGGAAPPPAATGCLPGRLAWAAAVVSAEGCGCLRRDPEPAAGGESAATDAGGLRTAPLPLLASEPPSAAASLLTSTAVAACVSAWASPAPRCADAPTARLLASSPSAFTASSRPFLRLLRLLLLCASELSCATLLVGCMPSLAGAERTGVAAAARGGPPQLAPPKRMRCEAHACKLARVCMQFMTAAHALLSRAWFSAPGPCGARAREPRGRHRLGASAEVPARR